MHEHANSVDIRGSRDHVFALAADVPRWAEFLPHYRWIRVLDDTAPGRRLVEMACWRGWVPLTWRSYLDLAPAERRILFEHVGGGARGMRVEWRLTEHAGVTTATISHDLRDLANRLVATPVGRYVLAHHVIAPVAGRTLATMKALVEAGATGPDDATRLATRPDSPVPRDDDPRVGLLSWLPWAAWLVLGVVWGRWSHRVLAAAGETRRMDEPRGAWPLHLAAFAATFALLAPALPAGPLDRPVPFRQQTRRAPVLGLALEVAGFGLALWARATLGRYCTPRVAVADGQPLVQSGPYRVVRHPLYAGLLAAVLGQAVILGRWRGVAAVALLAASYWRKVAVEEAALRRHFGASYDAYAAKVPAFLPRLIGDA